MTKTPLERATELIFYDQPPTPGQSILLENIAELVDARIMGRLPAMIGDMSILEVPKELEHIAVEMIVRRFNRVGSEGMSAESVEGHSATYTKSDMREFEEAIDAWVDAQEDMSRKVVRFL